MAWIVPKTDWNNDSYFNAADFNRIKNNLEYLKDYASKLFTPITIKSLGVDRKPGDYFYADEINTMEDNLNTINKNTVNIDRGKIPKYVENGIVMDYKELNRLESMILELYTIFENQDSGRLKFTWNFGIWEEL